MNSKQINIMFVFIVSIVLYKLYTDLPQEDFINLSEDVPKSNSEFVDKAKSMINRPVRKINRQPLIECEGGMSKRSSDCNPTIASDYYAMRPIIQHNEYENILKQILIDSVDPIEEEEEEEEILDNYKYPMRFIYDGDEDNLMKFIMKRLEESYSNNNKNNKYAMNDTWKGESFSFLNKKIYGFLSEKIDEKQPVKKSPKKIKYVVNFSLFNNHRYSSNDIIIEVFKKDNQFKIKSAILGTFNVKNTVEGVDITSDIDINSNTLKACNNVPKWLYGNTLENLVFNEHGFYEEGNNKLIQGGVPDDLVPELEKYSQQFLPEVSHEPILPKGYKPVQLRGFKVESV